jgi:thioredoxin reductase
MPTPTPSLFDVLIIGGGPAGLSTATGLARQLYTAIVFDSGVYRNAKAPHMHNVVGWDHRNAGELRAAGRSDLLKRYATVEFHDGQIETIRRTESGIFEAVDADGKVWRGRKLVLATGVRDVPPLDLPGYAECWATGM